MGDKLTKIRIDSGLQGGNTPVGVNGTVVDIPHDKDVEVTDAHLQALRDSNVKFTIVDGAGSASKATGEAAGGFAASPAVPAAPVSENPPPGPAPEPLVDDKAGAKATAKDNPKASDHIEDKAPAAKKARKAAAKKPAA